MKKVEKYRQKVIEALKKNGNKPMTTRQLCDATGLAYGEVYNATAWTQQFVREKTKAKPTRYQYRLREYVVGHPPRVAQLENDLAYARRQRDRLLRSYRLVAAHGSKVWRIRPGDLEMCWDETLQVFGNPSTYVLFTQGHEGFTPARMVETVGMEWQEPEPGETCEHWWTRQWKHAPKTVEDARVATLEAEVEAKDARVATLTSMVDEEHQIRLDLEVVVEDLHNKVKALNEDLSDALADSKRFQGLADEVAARFRSASADGHEGQLVHAYRQVLKDVLRGE